MSAWLLCACVSVGMLNSNIPGEVRDIVSEQEVMIGRIGRLESGDKGIDKLRENFTLLVKQVEIVFIWCLMLLGSVVESVTVISFC